MAFGYGYGQQWPGVGGQQQWGGVQQQQWGGVQQQQQQQWGGVQQQQQWGGMQLQHQQQQQQQQWGGPQRQPIGAQPVRQYSGVASAYSPQVQKPWGGAAYGPPPNIRQGAVIAVGAVSSGMVRIQGKPASVLAAEAKKLRDDAARALAPKKDEPQTGEKRTAEKNQGSEQKKQKKQTNTNTEQKSRTVVPDDFALDETKVYTGSVAAFQKTRGCGWITLDEKGFAPTDKVFVFWKDLNSTDRYPFLMEEQRVQFTLKKEKDKKEGKTMLCAHTVCQVGGAPLSCQEEEDAKKDFVVSRAARFTGKLKFFNPNRKYGLIALDVGQTFRGAEVGKELRVEFSEVNCAGGQPGYLVELRVEFGIVKNKEQYRAHNLTGPSLTPLPSIEESPMPPKEEALPKPGQK